MKAKEYFFNVIKSSFILIPILNKFGYEINEKCSFDQSPRSNSTYISIFKIGSTYEQFKLRVSDHSIPEYGQMPDNVFYDIFSENGSFESSFINLYKCIKLNEFYENDFCTCNKNCKNNCEKYTIFNTKNMCSKFYNKENFIKELKLLGCKKFDFFENYTAFQSSKDGIIFEARYSADNRYLNGCLLT